MRKVVVIFILLTVFLTSFVAESSESKFPAGTKLAPAKKVKLILSEKEYSELDYPSRPCVLDDMVNLIPNETVMVEAEVSQGRLVNLKYVSRNRRPERTIKLEFIQNQDRKSPFMILKIENPFNRGLKYEAGIQPYGQEGFHKTSTLVVRPGLSCFESWPNPLTRILLKNFQLVEE